MIDKNDKYEYSIKKLSKLKNEELKKFSIKIDEDVKIVLSDDEKKKASKSKKN